MTELTQLQNFITALDLPKDLQAKLADTIGQYENPAPGFINIAWSPELQADLQALPAQKRRAILTIIQDEANGLSLVRRLKTAYSCPTCGWFAQQQLGERAERKAALGQHILTCENRLRFETDHQDGQPVISGGRWVFIANVSTFYNKWMKDKDKGGFVDCLGRARAEFTNHALSNAAEILKRATPVAASELVRQVNGAEKDSDRRQASVAILDRADLTTADKTFDPVKEWLDDLRDDEESE